MIINILNKAKLVFFMFITILLVSLVALKYGHSQPSNAPQQMLAKRSVSLNIENETICTTLCAIVGQTGCKLKLHNVSGHMRGYTFSIKCDKILVKDLLDILFSKHLIRYYVIDGDTLHTEMSTIASP